MAAEEPDALRRACEDRRPARPHPHRLAAQRDPAQWLRDDAWAEEDSGKFARLREIAEVVAARQEKLLIFTQFREMTEPLAAHLGRIFGRAGLARLSQLATRNPPRD